MRYRRSIIVPMILQMIPMIPVIVALHFISAFGQSQKTDQSSPAAPDQKQKASYSSLVEKAKKQDPFLDFTALRLAFSETADYDPYGPNPELRTEMFKSLRAKQYENAIATAQKILAKAFINIDAHLVSAIACRETGKLDQAEYHKWIVEKLSDSIAASGDGKSFETAFVVVAINEEYALLRRFGLQMKSQALMHQKEHSFDQLTGVDPDTN